MSDASSPGIAPRGSNALLRRVVVLGTVLSLATAYGWMASFERQPGGQMVFRWGIATWLWALIGASSSIYFWQKLWPPNDRSRATRNQIIGATGVLLVPSLWWLTFPLRSLKGQNFQDVVGGLAAAALILSFGAWMVTRLIKAFERSDSLDLADLESTEAPAHDTDAAKKQQIS